MKSIHFSSRTLLAVLCIFAFLGCSRTTADLIDVISVEQEAKWESIILISWTWHPRVTVKFQNNSNKTIKNTIAVKCQFIVNDEIVGEDNQILHSEKGAPWGKGLSKTLEFNYSGTSISILDMAAKRENLYMPPRIKARIVYDDNSLVWEGYFEPERFNPDDPYNVKSNN